MTPAILLVSCYRFSNMTRILNKMYVFFDKSHDDEPLYNKIIDALKEAADKLCPSAALRSAMKDIKNQNRNLAQIVLQD